MKDIFKSIFLGLAVLFCAACTNEWEESCDGQALREGEVSLQWLPANMGIKHVKTRGTDPKTAEEQEIHNVHVFIFKQDGSYLRATDSDAFQGYRYLDGSQNLVLQTNMFESGAENAIVVAVANVGQDVFGNMTGEGHPENVPNLAALHDFKYELPSITATLPANGLPMLGEANANLASGTTEKVTLIQLKSLMARIDLDFTMDPYQSSDDRRNPALRIDEVRVVNFPKGCTLSPQLASDADTETKDIQLQGETVVEGLDDFIGRILRVGEPQELTLYMFEHGRAAKDYTYPEGIDESERQRYKNKLADEKAAYIEMEGVYTNHNGYKYAVVYRLYPGNNATNDFTIRSNCQYKNNISVKGITVNNMGKEALLDTRVDIDSDRNPYFIEMLRELEHDAHFCVTPMDVFIYRGGSVKVTIQTSETNTSAPTWIRMKPLERAATIAGDGKEPYFTTDLVSSLDESENISYTITSNDNSQTHEERIYFYIDENTPSESQAAEAQEVPSREAVLRIDYTGGDSSTIPWNHTRYILIRQRGMLPVVLPTYQSVYTGYTFYIECYEEYLEYYDGKDSFTQTYDGLPWGLKGIETGLGGTDGNLYLPYGWRNTMQMMRNFRLNLPEGENDDIMLNEKPRSAAEYCYNKNKRNSNGEVEYCHWYLPTIRELEHAMDKYYGTFREFQNNWYWSANPGNYGGRYYDSQGKFHESDGRSGADYITWTGEHVDYARATKSMLKSGDIFEHARSEADRPYAKKSDGTWDTPYDPAALGPGYVAMSVSE